jgi:hypothetical protein
MPKHVTVPKTPGSEMETLILMIVAWGRSAIFLTDLAYRKNRGQWNKW